MWEMGEPCSTKISQISSRIQNKTFSKTQFTIRVQINRWKISGLTPRILPFLSANHKTTLRQIFLQKVLLIFTSLTTATIQFSKEQSLIMDHQRQVIWTFNSSNNFLNPQLFHQITINNRLRLMVSLSHLENLSYSINSTH